MPAYSLSLHMLQDFSPQGSRDETGQEVITLQEESQELMVQQVTVQQVTVQQQVTAQQQVTVQEGQEKKVSFRINFQKQHTITCCYIASRS